MGMYMGWGGMLAGRPPCKGNWAPSGLWENVMFVVKCSNIVYRQIQSHNNSSFCLTPCHSLYPSSRFGNIFLSSGSSLVKSRSQTSNFCFQCNPIQHTNHRRQTITSSQQLSLTVSKTDYKKLLKLWFIAGLLYQITLDYTAPNVF